jgi:isoleucyl-tRNA synthetase
MCKEVKWNKKDFKTIQKLKGKDIVGLSYDPLFPYFKERKEFNNFKVISAAYVTADSGTCIVHQAPAFGEDDF